MVVILDTTPTDYALIKALIGSGDSGNAEELPADLWDADADGNMNAPPVVAPALPVPGPLHEYMIPYSSLSNASWRGTAIEIKEAHADHQGSNLFTNNENIYIYGHGMQGGVWTQPNHGGTINNFNNIVAWLKLILPEGWSGGIHLMTCNSSVAPDTGDQRSAAKKISDAWNQDIENEDEHIAVSGQNGFAYGMGDGTMAVLKDEFSDMYNAADSGGLNEVTTQHLSEMALAIGGAEVYRLINVTVRDYTRGELPGIIAQAFVVKKVGIETRLKAIINAAAGATIYAKKAAAAADVEFTGLIMEQKNLFEAFGLWNPAGEVTV